MKSKQKIRHKTAKFGDVVCSSNLFYNSPMEACVVICRMNKPKARRNKVLFINAVNEVTRERAQSFLTDDHIERIVAAYEAFADVDGLARVVGSEYIREQGCNLSIPLYVRAEASGNVRVAESRAAYGDGDLRGAIAAWQESSVALRGAMNILLTRLDEVVKK